MRLLVGMMVALDLGFIAGEFASVLHLHPLTGGALGILSGILGYDFASWAFQE